jgi:hypothetical protein
MAKENAEQALARAKGIMQKLAGPGSGYGHAGDGDCGRGMSDTLAVLTEAEKLAKVADAIGAAYATELARVLRDLERELRRWCSTRRRIADGARARGARREAAPRTADGADGVRLRRPGRDRDVVVARSARRADGPPPRRGQAGGVHDVGPVADPRAEGNRPAGPARRRRGVSHALWRTLAQGLYSQRKVVDLLEDLSDAVDVEESRLRTLYDTTVSIFGRQVEAMKSGPDDVFAYVGPVDAKLRPFCRQHVGKVYTRAEIDALDNGQLPNTFLTGGGYNCRHVFQAVSKFSELRDLVGTDTRMPEVGAPSRRCRPAERRPRDQLALARGDRRGAGLSVCARAARHHRGIRDGAAHRREGAIGPRARASGGREAALCAVRQDRQRAADAARPRVASGVSQGCVR